MKLSKKQRVGVGAKQTKANAPPVYDPVEGKKALDALGPELDALPESALGPMRFDVEMATFAALAVAGFVGAREVRARFARLPVEEIAEDCVDCLAPACFATLYALAEARAAGALETDAKIAASIIAEATEVEQRMQSVCEYHLADDPEVAPELDRLRPGKGYRDLANDLHGYARLYELRREVVKGDPKHYRAGDAARARELAGIIIQGLSAAMTPRARTAYDRYLRSWALLEQRYSEVRAAGQWLFRKDARRDELFPSLVTASRPTVQRRRAGSTEETSQETSAPAPAGAANDATKNVA
jgi:hypothetical protein